MIRVPRIPLLIVALFHLVAPNPTDAGPYSWTGGLPESGRIYDLVIDPTDSQTVYAATRNNGVFVSSDGGATWSLTSNAPGFGAFDLAIAGDGTLFVALSRDQMAMSDDGGATWNAIDSGVADSDVRQIAVATPNPDILVAGLLDGSVIYSSNGGITFGTATGLPSTRLRALTFATGSTSMVYAATTSPNAVHRSIDGGMTWNSYTDGLPSTHGEGFATSAADPDLVFLWTNSGSDQIYVIDESDPTPTWTLANSTLTGNIQALAVAPDDAQSLLAVGTAGAFVSTDGGATWDMPKDLDGLFTEAAVLSSDLSRGAVRYGLIGTSHGFLRSGDLTNWAPSNTGLRATRCLPTTSVDNRNEIFCDKHVSADGGASWISEPIAPGVHDTRSTKHARSNPAVVYTIWNGIYRSNDRGKSWTSQITDPASYGGFPEVSSMAVQGDNEDNLLIGNISYNFGAGTPPLFLQSTDGGQTATPLFTPALPVDAVLDPIEAYIHPTDSTKYTAVAVRLESGNLSTTVYSSTTAGTSWDTFDFSSRVIFELARSPVDPDLMWAGVIDPGVSMEIRLSKDSGKTFGLPVPTAPPCRGFLTAGPSSVDELFLTCDQMYRSADGGMSWTPLPTDGLPPDVRNILKLQVFDDPRHYIAGTNAGVFTFTEALFVDGFESGNTAKWSSSVP